MEEIIDINKTNGLKYKIILVEPTKEEEIKVKRCIVNFIANNF